MSAKRNARCEGVAPGIGATKKDRWRGAIKALSGVEYCARCRYEGELSFPSRQRGAGYMLLLPPGIAAHHLSDLLKGTPKQLKDRLVCDPPTGE